MMYLDEVDRIKRIREDMVARGEPLYTLDMNHITHAIRNERNRVDALYQNGWITGDEKAKLNARLRRLQRRSYALADIGWVMA